MGGVPKYFSSEDHTGKWVNVYVALPVFMPIAGAS